MSNVIAGRSGREPWLLGVPIPGEAGCWFTRTSLNTRWSKAPGATSGEVVGAHRTQGVSRGCGSGPCLVYRLNQAGVSAIGKTFDCERRRSIARWSGASTHESCKNAWASRRSRSRLARPAPAGPTLLDEAAEIVANAVLNRARPSPSDNKKPTYNPARRRGEGPSLTHVARSRHV